MGCLSAAILDVVIMACHDVFFGNIDPKVHTRAMETAEPLSGDEGGLPIDESDLPVSHRMQITDDGIQPSGVIREVIIDWHILSDGDPNKYLDDVAAFFDDISAACKDKNNVIYEICNEPNGVEWSRIREYAETIIPIIRNNDPDSVIVVGTPDWSQRVDIAADEPLDFQNLLYALHFYSATHKQELRDKARYAIDKQLPVFVTEYGVTASTGNFPYDMEEADVWIDFLEENGISHVMWNFSKVSESSAAIKASVLKVSGFEYDDFSKSGQWLIDMISSRSGAAK